MDVVRSIMRLLNEHGTPLPGGVDDWLEKHPKRAARLYEDLQGMGPYDYIEFGFAAAGTIWAPDDDHAAERLGWDLSGGGRHLDVTFRWTGRWRIETLPREAWAAVDGAMDV